MVKILYFARLREDLGRAEENLVLPEGTNTVAGLRSHLTERGGIWQTALADARALQVAVNQEMALPATSIKPGDEVAFFPPVTGG